MLYSEASVSVIHDVSKPLVPSFERDPSDDSEISPLTLDLSLSWDESMDIPTTPPAPCTTAPLTRCDCKGESPLGVTPTRDGAVCCCDRASRRPTPSLPSRRLAVLESTIEPVTDVPDFDSSSELIV